MCSFFAENNFLPSFEETSLSAVVYKNNVDDVITYVTATDKDGEKCRDSDADCPCARILYALESGNEESLFRIHPKTGAIQLSGKGIRDKSEFPRAGTKVKLVVSARNPVHRSRSRIRREQEDVSNGDNVVDTMIVMVEFDDEPGTEIGFDRYRKMDNHAKNDVGSRFRRSLDDDDSQEVHSRRKRSVSLILVTFKWSKCQSCK